MPSIFETLATVNAWTLFVVGWLALLSGYLRLIGAYSGLDLTAMGGPTITTGLIGGMAGLTLSVVLMKVRQVLE